MTMKTLFFTTIACVAFMLIFGVVYNKEESFAVPAYAGVRILTQPNGTTFSARVFGDEWGYSVEITDGYTIMQNQQNYWTYAIRDDDGRVVPSTMIVGIDKPSVSGISKHLTPTKTILEKASSQMRIFKSSKRAAPSTGILNLPVLLINFSDKPGTVPPADFNALLFSSGTNSLKDYYQEVSYNKLNVLGSVVAWYTAANNHDYYGQDDPHGLPGDDLYPETLVIEAVTAADNTVNFADYDADGDCYVDTVIVVHQGMGQETTLNVYDIWSHKGSLGAKEVITTDSCIADSSKLIKVNEYTIQPEIAGDGGQMTIGVFAHEFGHALGLPDLYDTDLFPAIESNGVGNWSLMASGDHNSISRSGDLPAHPDAWSKAVLGWVTPTTKVRDRLMGETIQAAATTADVYQFLSGVPGQSGEYFLVENRYRTGFDAGLPGSGLAIWHIDEKKSDNTAECYPSNDCSTTH